MKYAIELDCICGWEQWGHIEDEDGNELLNEDGSVKLFTQSRDIDLSWVSDSVCEDDVEEIKL